MELFVMIFSCIKRGRLFILFAAFVWLILGAFFAMQLPNYGQFQFDPPSGSPSAVAYDKVKQYFPSLLYQDTELVLISCPNCEASDPKFDIFSSKSSSAKNICREINETLYRDFPPGTPLGVLSVSSVFTTQAPPNASQSIVNKMNSFIKPKFVAKDNKSMILIFSIALDNADQNTINNGIDSLDSSTQKIGKKYGYDVQLTGGLTLFRKSLLVIEKDMVSKDIYVFPIIMLFMAYIVKSWKLIIISGLTLGVSVCSSFVLFLPFAKYGVIKLNPLAPTIMLFLCMALSVDYSMFLLSRFSQERAKGVDVDHAVQQMIQYSGHVVGLSGTVLIICYLGLAFFPISGLDSAGYGAALAIATCIVTNVSVSGALILQFPKFFGVLPTRPKWLNRCIRRIRERCFGCCFARDIDNRWKLSDKGQLLNSPNMSVQSEDDVRSEFGEDDDHERYRNCYYVMAKFSTKWPWNVIIPLVVYALMIPVGIRLLHYQEDMDFTFNFPRNIPANTAYKRILSDYSGGDFAPFYILTTPKNDSKNEVLKYSYGNSVCGAAKKVYNEMNKPMISGYNFIVLQKQLPVEALNISIKPGLYCVPKMYWSKLQNMVTHPMDPKNKSQQIGYFYQTYFNRTVNPDRTASMMLLQPNFNPFLGTAKKPLAQMREILKTASKSEGSTANYYLHTGLAWQLDSMTQTYQKMPIILTCIIIVVFLLIGFIFWAVFLPFRLLLAVVVPLFFVYGMLTAVYQDGWLDFLHITPIHSTGGLFWILPVMTITILIGLAMDYEIFLFSRVWEYRKNGYDTRAAVVLGVASTGPIISSAGVVMALAFLGLLIQDITASNQLGFVMVFGVLIDTFIVRPLLVPSVLSYVDWMNFWPTKMPDVDLKTLELLETAGDDAFVHGYLKARDVRA